MSPQVKMYCLHMIYTMLLALLEYIETVQYNTVDMFDLTFFI